MKGSNSKCGQFSITLAAMWKIALKETRLEQKNQIKGYNSSPGGQISLEKSSELKSACLGDYL